MFSQRDTGRFHSAQGQAEDYGQDPSASSEQRAANILLNDPSAEVVALPDLYPPDEGGSHHSAGELAEVLTRSFRTELRRKSANDERAANRFHVHCFKHDLEALLLAVPGSLFARLGVEAIPVEWSVPVEDHDHGDPPKRVVERLFTRYSQAYKAAVDAPLILGRVNYADVAEACQQCFKPFVELLESFCVS